MQGVPGFERLEQLLLPRRGPSAVEQREHAKAVPGVALQCVPFRIVYVYDALSVMNGSLPCQRRWDSSTQQSLTRRFLFCSALRVL